MMIYAIGTNADTGKVYDNYKNRLLQVQIIDTESNAKSTIGSGFFVNESGLIVTNYHVVSRLIHHPTQYQVQFVDSEGDDPQPAKLLKIDVVHDLALLQSNRKKTDFLKIRTKRVRKGTRLYSLGNPHDLGMTIVEGTFNGFIDDSLHERDHLTASINPGMSGGPTINGQGEVVGVNVATAGNQIGFLVPSKYVAELVKNTPGEVPQPENMLSVLSEQLQSNQTEVTKKLTRKSLPYKTLGTYQVAGSMVKGLNCWGDSSYEEDLLYNETSYTCTNKHDIFVSENFTTGKLSYSHRYLSSSKVGHFHFYTILQDHFSRPNFSSEGDKETVTSFECETSFVDNKILLKVALCIRGYKKLRGLYDLVLNIVTVNENQSGLHSNLSLRGFSYENSIKLARRYLEAIKWKEQ